MQSVVRYCFNLISWFYEFLYVYDYVYDYLCSSYETSTDAHLYDSPIKCYLFPFYKDGLTNISL